jgi:hypothetical protein
MLSARISASRLTLISSAARLSLTPVLSSTRIPRMVPRMIQFGDFGLRTSRMGTAIPHEAAVHLGL